eukprot:m.457158 g.457158  ORF g.457158 m.457158 type:complete len:588 (+) comp21209_c0_seq1:110-1873(+)
MASGTRNVVWGKSHPTISQGGLNDDVIERPKKWLTEHFWRKLAIAFCAVLGLTFFITGLTSKTIVDGLIMEQVKAQAKLDDPTSDVFQQWADPMANGLILYMQITVWNLTNPTEYLKGASPELDMVGPFTFYENRLKHSFQFSEDKSIVWYKENVSYVPVERQCPPGTHPLNYSALCTIPLSTKIYSVNIPFITAINLLRFLGPLENGMIEWLNNQIKKEERPEETIVIHRNVSEVVFGYHDPLLELLDNELKLSNITNVTNPNFSLLTNNSLLDAMNYSGVHTRSSEGNFGEYVAWQGFNGSVPYWTGCSEIDNLGRVWNADANYLQGTEGLFFQPGIKKGQSLYSFTGDLGRSGSLSYNSTTTYNDVEVFRYIIPPEDFANVEESPSACAYSNFGMSGSLNMTTFVGAPVFATKPFFLDADPRYSENLTNFSPGPGGVTREEFDTFLDIEPYSGTVLNAQKQIQSALHVQPAKHVTVAEKLPYSYFPIMINAERGSIPRNITQQLADTIGTAVSYGGYYFYGGTTVGALLIVLALVLGFRLHRQLNGLEAEENTENGTSLSASSPLLGQTRDQSQSGYLPGTNSN